MAPEPIFVENLSKTYQVPEREGGFGAAVKAYLGQGLATNEKYVGQAMREVPFGAWREYNPEDTVRFYALRLREAGMVKKSPQQLLAEGTDWRLLDQLKKAAQADGDVYVSIIPFSKDVNAGASNYGQTWIDWTDWEEVNGTCSSTSYMRDTEPTPPPGPEEAKVIFYRTSQFGGAEHFPIYELIDDEDFEIAECLRVDGRKRSLDGGGLVIERNDNGDVHSGHPGPVKLRARIAPFKR